MELLPGFEPGTSTLPRWCSTCWAITAWFVFWYNFCAWFFLTKVVLDLLSHNSMCRFCGKNIKFLRLFLSANQVLPRWCSTYWAITACMKFWVVFDDFFVNLRVPTKSYQGGALPTVPHQHSSNKWNIFSCFCFF